MISYDFPMISWGWEWLQKSDAGVGIGMLIGDRITLLKNREIGKMSFHVFDRN